MSFVVSFLKVFSKHVSLCLCFKRRATFYGSLNEIYLDT